MLFSTVKHKEIRTELIANIKEEGQKIRTTDVAKLVSKAWKALPEEEREQWDEIARQDKARYEIEKLTYTGPWKVPIYAATTQQQPPQSKHNKNNKKRHNQRRPPKRPLSAFLLFSNATRSDVKHKYPDAPNADIPTILAQMWKDADPYEKQLFVDEQFRLEQQYHQTMLEWEPSNSSSSINNSNSATTTTRTSSEPLCLTTSMGTNNSSAAYCTNMAANVFDDLSPYSSLSMNRSGAGTSTGATGPLSSSTTYNGGGYDPYNQGPYQQQYHHHQDQQQQQQHQHQQPPQYPHYDHAAAAYNYRNPYGETQQHPSSYGYQLPTSAGFPVATATATNHTSSYEGGYERRGSQQQHAYEYEYNAAHAHAQAPVHAPVTA